MKFKIKVKFNGLYNNSEVERIVDEKDWPIEMGILKAMVMSREIDSFKVTLDLSESLECEFVSMSRNLRNLAKRMGSCIN